MADIQSLLDAVSKFEKFHSGPPATDEAVARIERTLGVTLDAGYRTFLKRLGYVRWLGKSIFGCYELDPAMNGFDSDAVRRTKEARKEKPPKGFKPLPRDAVVIGDDGAGGYFVLRSAGASGAGEVVWFNWDDPGAASERWPSFAAYVEYLVANDKR